MASYGTGSATKQVFATGLLETSTTDTDIVGTLREDELGNKYRFVKNVDATALVQGQPVAWDSAANVGTADYFSDVTLAVTAELPNMAGICMTGIAISGGAHYGWVQVWGIAKNARVLTPATGADDIEEGSELVGANTGLNLVYQGNAGTAPIYVSNFIALEVVATATGAAVVNKDVFVRCM